MGGSSSSSSTAATSRNITLQDIEGFTVAGNDAGGDVSVNITDGGAFAVVDQAIRQAFGLLGNISGASFEATGNSLTFAGDVMENAAGFTLDILDRQIAESRQAVAAIQDAFATATAPDVEAIQQNTKLILLVAGGLALAVIFSRGS